MLTRRPYCFCLMRSSARLPNAIGTMESSASGSPERTRYPSRWFTTSIRRPWLYFADDSFSAAPIRSAIPPSLRWPYMSVSSPSKLIPSCEDRRSPSDASTTEYRLGFLLRSRVSSSASRSTSTGCSGITQRSAAPAIVGSSDVKPAYRPNTSITRKRSCEPAEVRSRCVSSMVRVTQALGVAEGVVPADRDQHVHADVLEVLEHVLGDVVDRLVVAPPGQVRRQPLARQMARPD